MFMVWPTLGSRIAEEANRTEQTYGHDLDRAKMSVHDKYSGQRSFSSKCIILTHT